MTDDIYFMQMALDLAEKGRGFTSPNPVVGAVVVKKGRIAGKGYHKSAGSAHAEVNAINEAGDHAEGSTLYVTLEPCNHTGRTPPCTQKIYDAGIKRVVIAMNDPNPDVQGGGIDYLKGKGIHVTLGVCEDQAARQNEVFLKYVKTKRPFVILKCAATLDGYIATKTGDSKWITCPESRQFSHNLRHECDAIMVGIGTVKKDNPRLTARLDQINCMDPVRVILDSHLSICENAHVLNHTSDSDTIIVTGADVSKNKKLKIEKKGVKVISSSVKNGLIDLNILMDRLGSDGITSLVIEGGSRVTASALDAKIVDKICFFYGPKILGSNDGVPLCRGDGPSLINGCISVTDIQVSQFNDDVLIEGYIKNR